MSFLILAGMKCVGLTVGLRSVVPIIGTAGAATTSGMVAAGLSKTSTLAWKSWIDMDKRVDHGV